MKDLFSDQSELYQQARPSYPQSVISEILRHLSNRELAWDCGAGSGQFTQLLAPHFAKVIATDLSDSQLKQAPQFENVSYQVANAEQTNFADHCFDLITVAQAIHWFNFDAFYQEVHRTLKHDGVLAVIGYGLIQVDDAEIDQFIQQFYAQTLKSYWDAERRYIDEQYQTIPFPFQEIETSSLKMNFKWSLQQIVAYLNTWSALKHYLKEQQPLNGKFEDPFAAILQNVKSRNLNIETHTFNIQFPLYLRIGRKLNT